MSDMAVVSKKSKDRSPNFPFINLERAIERAREFYAEEKRGVAPLSRAAVHWKFSESSSSALQTVSALKSYNLLVETGGSGKGRQLQLTDLALRIILDQRPESEDRVRLIREAATAPSIASDVYERWPELPSDSTLNHYLVLDRRFNEATAPSVVRILKENHWFARVGSDSVVSGDMGIADNTVVEQVARAPTRLDEARQLPADQAPRVRASAPESSGHVEQLASLDGGTTVTLTFSAKPDVDFWEWIAFYAKAKADKLAKVKAAERPIHHADPGRPEDVAGT